MAHTIEGNNNNLLLRLEEIASTCPEAFSKSYYKSFHINRIEDYKPSATVKKPPYRKVVHDMLFLTQGSTIRTKGLDRRIINKNSIFIVPAYQIRTSEEITEDAQGYFCHFDMEIFNKGLFPPEIFKAFSFLQYTGEPLIEVADSSISDVIQIFERLVKDYTTPPPPNFNLICSYLLTLFFELNRQTGIVYKYKNTSALLTQRFQDALMNHVYELHSVHEFSDLMKVTSGYLNRCVKETTGKTAHQMLVEMQMLEAKFLLKQSDLSIGEIAFKLANQNHSHFSRTFKRNTGISPKEFRNSLPD